MKIINRTIAILCLLLGTGAFIAAVCGYYWHVGTAAASWLVAGFFWSTYDDDKEDETWVR